MLLVSSIVCRAESFREKSWWSKRSFGKNICRKRYSNNTHSDVNPKRHLNKSRLHLNDAGIFLRARSFQAFLTNLDWQEYDNNVSDNSPFVIGDTVSSNDIIRMKQRLDNATNIIIGHLNINSFRNKFVFIEDVIKLFDVFLVSETKLDHTFPSNQFRINGYKSFRLDRNRFVGGLILYINESIPCKPLQEYVDLPNFEVTLIELYKNNQKWILLGIYKPPNKKTSNFLSLILDLV